MSTRWSRCDTNEEGAFSVVTLILRQSVVLLVAGVVIGVVFALAAAQSADSLLYGLRPNHPRTFFGASVLLAAVALVASVAPTRRPSCLDPGVALRQDNSVPIFE